MGIAERVEGLAEVFGSCELDKVMEYFTPDSVYTCYNGRRCEGLAAIRKEFSGFFSGKYGRLIFHEELMIVDEEAKKVVFTYACEHDLSQECGLLLKPLKYLLRKNRKWTGVDVFVFDDEGHYILEKNTYCHGYLPKINFIM